MESSAMLTAYRFEQLKAGAEPADEAEKLEYQRELESERRRAAARRAVQTKRAKYTRWPTRASDHERR
jgi:hypothetical protein